MGSPSDRLVYYSLALTDDPRSTRALAQLLRSAASLRAHAPEITVVTFVCGALPDAARAELDRLGVEVVERGDHEAHLSAFVPPRMAEVLALYPTLHYATSLVEIARRGAARVLYLDTDTFLFDDVGRLFDRYRELDLYAREEPHSRTSAAGHRPEVFDDAAVEAFAVSRGLRFVPPFNKGVLLMSARIVSALAERVPAMLRDVFRFSVWLADHRAGGGPAYPDLDHLRAHRARLVTPEDEAGALPYPLANAWVKDQLALWLAVGAVPWARTGLLSPRDVMQGHEFTRAGAVTQTAAHYFSGNTDLFERWRAEGGAVRRRDAPPVPRPDADRHPALEAFAELGDRVAGAWDRDDHDERAFPALAVDLLAAADLPSRLGIDDVIRWVVRARRMPPQDDLGADFGDPPITVYSAPRFYIQVILWLEGTTAVHRHGFSGAFQVLAGSSLHARYAFVPRQRAATALISGDLRLQGAEILSRGEVRSIENGLIHSLFHLDTPSATVVVRTRTEQEAQPQYDYLPPHLAYVRGGADAPTVRREQVIRFLDRTGHPEAEALAVEAMDRADLGATFHLLRAAAPTRGVGARLDPLIEAARRRHGPVADEIAASIREDARRGAVGRLRREARDEGLRFFLALLENLPHRGEILALVARRFPDTDPRDRVLGFLRAVSGVDRCGVDLDDPLNRELCALLLDGASPDEVRAGLSRAFDPEAVRAQAAAIDAHVARLRGTTLAPLFTAGR